MVKLVRRGFSVRILIVKPSSRVMGVAKRNVLNNDCRGV